MIFDWDENKEKSNIKNHDGVNFNEASRAIHDDFALEEYDDAHSTADEKRYIVSAKAKTKFCISFYTVR